MIKTYSTYFHTETLTIYPKQELNDSKRSTEPTQEIDHITVCVIQTKESNTNDSSTNGSINWDSDKLSQEFNKHYQDIETYTKKLVNYLNKQIDVSWILSECYLYLHSNLASINDTKTLVSYAKNWIKSNCKWSNSPLNRQIRLNNNPEQVDYSTETSNIYSFDTDKIESQIEDFRSSLSPYDKRLFSIYFDLDLKKGKDVSAHLNIPLSSSYPIINECKQIELQLRQHIKKNNSY
jgi:hypothetical protein